MEALIKSPSQFRRHQVQTRRVFGELLAEIPKHRRFSRILSSSPCFGCRPLSDDSQESPDQRSPHRRCISILKSARWDRRISPRPSHYHSDDISYETPKIMFFFRPSLPYLIFYDLFVKLFASQPIIFQDEFSAGYCIPPTPEATRLCPEARSVPLRPILSMENTKASPRLHEFSVL